MGNADCAFIVGRVKPHNCFVYWSNTDRNWRELLKLPKGKSIKVFASLDDAEKAARWFAESGSVKVYSFHEYLAVFN